MKWENILSANLPSYCYMYSRFSSWFKTEYFPSKDRQVKASILLFLCNCHVILSSTNKPSRTPINNKASVVR